MDRPTIQLQLPSDDAPEKQTSQPPSDATTEKQTPQSPCSPKSPAVSRGNSKKKNPPSQEKSKSSLPASSTADGDNSAKEKDRIGRFFEKVKTGLMARKFNQNDPKAEASYREFMEKNPPPKGNTANFTPEQVDLVNKYILSVRALLSKGQEPEQWPLPDYAKSVPSDFLQILLDRLPAHVKQHIEELKKRATSILQPQSQLGSNNLRSDIELFRDTEVCPLQQAVDPPADIPKPFWDGPLGKAFQDLNEVLTKIQQDLKNELDKLNDRTSLPNVPATEASTERHQEGTSPKSGARVRTV